jgi:hypothetical protein
VAAFLTDDDVICPECAAKRLNFDENQVLADLTEEAEKAGGGRLSWADERDLQDRVNEMQRAAEEAADLHPLIQYNLDSDETWQEDGLCCGSCGCELVEPYPEEKPTTTCRKCGEDFPDSSMVPADDDEGGEYCVGCAPKPKEE